MGIYEEYVDTITGKDVIVVGPSASVADDCVGISVDSYDFVCRINGHWKNISSEDYHIGLRTDILYHCMNTEQYNVKDIEIWNEEGIFLLSPYDVSNVNDSRRRGITFKKRNKDTGLEFINLSKYCLNMNKEFGCFLNTGTLAIVHLLSLPVKTVTTVGFDFYETHYLNNPNEALRKIIKDNNKTHNIKLQFKNFKKHVSNIDKFIPKGRLKTLLTGT